MSTHGLNDVEEEGSPATNVRPRPRGIKAEILIPRSPDFGYKKTLPLPGVFQTPTCASHEATKAGCRVSCAVTMA